jgi:FkbM family methyltransferase
MRSLLDVDFFVDYLLNCTFADLQTKQADNYDWDRFSADGVDRSDVPYTDLHKQALLVLTRNSDALFRAYTLLEDETSRCLFVDLLRYRLAGHKHVRLPTNNDVFNAKVKAARAIAGRPSSLDVNLPPPITLSHYEYEFACQKLSMDLMTLIWPFGVGQYFYDRDGVRVQPVIGDHVVDAGACLGDTAMAFGASVGPQGAVYMFEIMDVPLKICRHNICQNRFVSRFKLFEQGLSDRTCEGKASAATGSFDPGFELKEDDDRFPTTTIDTLVQSGDIERIDFIKMDIEGAELRALKGARESLCRFKPKLALSLYHNVRDFHEIPTFLAELGLGYRFYLDHYTIHAGETVLYATV